MIKAEAEWERRKMINKKMLEDLKKLGIKENDTLLMHSSLSKLGHIEGGADTVIDTLIACLKEGTLLMPCHSYGTVTLENPVFSIKDTPACVGIIPETFRKRAGVIRSMHPTHSVCGFGKKAKELLSEHINTNTPVGSLSPYALLPKVNGKILMLGCGLRPDTSFHGIEEAAGVSYALSNDFRDYTLIDENGNKTVKPYRYHFMVQRGFIQRYDRIADFMALDPQKVLDADCYLLDAAKVWEIAISVMKENEFYFMDKKEG